MIIMIIFMFSDTPHSNRLVPSVLSLGLILGIIGLLLSSVVICLAFRKSIFVLTP